MVEVQLVVERSQNAASIEFNEVSSDHFSGTEVVNEKEDGGTVDVGEDKEGTVAVDEKEDGSTTAIDEKEEGSTAAVDEKEDERVREEVDVAYHCRLGEEVVPLRESTLELLQSNEVDRVGGAALDELALSRAQV